MSITSGRVWVLGYSGALADDADGSAVAGRTSIATVETRSFGVAGMSCEHCARAVRAEIGKLPGVTEVDVDVAAGTVRVTGEPVPDDAAVRDAVQEAGYEFAL